MKILVTGGAGYVGSSLVSRLAGDGHDVTVMDVFMFGYESSLPMILHPNISFVQKEVLDIERKDLYGYDVIFHLAGLSGVDACSRGREYSNQINSVATAKLANAKEAGQKLIYASTSSFYGVSAELCDELTEPSPVSYYGESKLAGERFVTDTPNSVALRFTTIFGVGNRMRSDLLVNDFVNKAINERCIAIYSGRSKRAFIHLDDAVDAYVFIMNKFDSLKHKVYNVGSDILNLSKLEIAYRIKAIIPCDVIEVSFQDKDVRSFQISYERLKEEGFTAHRTLEYGIHQLIKLYKFYGTSKFCIK